MIPVCKISSSISISVMYNIEPQQDTVAEVCPHGASASIVADRGSARLSHSPRHRVFILYNPLNARPRTVYVCST